MKNIFRMIASLAIVFMVGATFAACSKDRSIRLDKSEASVFIGETIELKATLTPEGSKEEVKWSTADESIATVNNGVVTGVSVGKTTITAQAWDLTATCSVTVSRGTVHVEQVTLDKSELKFKIGESATLTATVLPENADVKDVTWTSSDENVATVENGLVKGISAGNATITVKTVDGEKTAECKVVVEALTVYEELEKLSKLEYRSAVLTVKTTLQGIDLSDRYEVEKTENGYKVNFTQESLAPFGTDENGNIVVPENRKITLTGTVEYDSNWKEIGRTGSEVEIPIQSISIRYNFAEANFEALEKNDNVFHGTIQNVEGFLGTPLECTGMQITATVKEDRLDTFLLSYTSAAGASVEISISLNSIA